MSSNFIFILFAISFFSMALAPEMSANGIGKKLVLDQFRLMLSTIDMKKSLVVMQEAFNFINELGAMHDISLKRLECMMAEFNEQITQIGESYRKTKSENQSLQEQLKKRTKESEDNVLKVEQLSQHITDLIQQFTESNQTVQDMGSSLGQCQKSVQKLERQVEKLNNTVMWTRECEQKQHLDKIKPVLQAYINNSDWDTLKRGLEGALDINTVEYRQLQDVVSLWGVGYNGYTQLASLLLCAGLPVNTNDSFGAVILHGAAQEGHIELAKLLLERGVDVNVKTSNGWTLLMFAAANGHLEAVKYLVQAGADPTVKNDAGLTAFYWAREGGHTAVARYLQQLPQ